MQEQLRTSDFPIFWQYLAHLISFVFHPIFVTVYIIGFLIWANPYMFSEAPLILSLVTLNAVFFPLITILMMRQLDFLQSFTLENRQERIFALIPTMVFLIWTFTVFWRSTHPKIIANVLFGVCLALALVFVVNAVYEKISLHTTAMGGWFAVALFAPNIAVYDLTLNIIGVLLIAGLVGTCRLLVKAHTTREVYYGYVLGFMTMAMGLIWLR
ncbi:MAG: hypothetical protein ACPGXL_04460 [Chitinophagales bacterium]